MFDRQLRQLTDRPLARVAATLHQRKISADTLTVGGLILGVGAAAAAATGWWIPALGLWLSSRLLDGLDGAVARLAPASKPSARGGFHDLMADFTVYAAFVVAVALSVPEARLAAVFALAAYYLSATSFLAWSSLRSEVSLIESVDATGGASTLSLEDNRTVRFLGGLAEGFETIVAYSLICLFPTSAALILWIFAAMVLTTAAQRVWFASRWLSKTGNRVDHRRG